MSWTVATPAPRRHDRHHVRIAQLARDFGLAPDTVRWRLRRAAAPWTFAQAIGAEPRPRKPGLVEYRAQRGQKAKRRCRCCGERGHDRRHCVVAVGVSADNHCGRCGELGHNRRSCPLIPRAERTPVRCSSCNQAGHNARNPGCPEFTKR